MLESHPSNSDLPHEQNPLGELYLPTDDGCATEQRNGDEQPHEGSGIGFGWAAPRAVNAGEIVSLSPSLSPQMYEITAPYGSQIITPLVVDKRVTQGGVTVVGAHSRHDKNYAELTARVVQQEDCGIAVIEVYGLADLPTRTCMEENLTRCIASTTPFDEMRGILNTITDPWYSAMFEHLAGSDIVIKAMDIFRTDPACDETESALVQEEIATEGLRNLMPPSKVYALIAKSISATISSCNIREAHMAHDAAPILAQLEQEIQRGNPTKPLAIIGGMAHYRNMDRITGMRHQAVATRIGEILRAEIRGSFEACRSTDDPVQRDRLIRKDMVVRYLNTYGALPVRQALTIADTIDGSDIDQTLKHIQIVTTLPFRPRWLVRNCITGLMKQLIDKGSRKTSHTKRKQ